VKGHLTAAVQLLSAFVDFLLMTVTADASKQQLVGYDFVNTSATTAWTDVLALRNNPNKASYTFSYTLRALEVDSDNDFEFEYDGSPLAISYDIEMTQDHDAAERQLTLHNDESPDADMSSGDVETMEAVAEQKALREVSAQGVNLDCCCSHGLIAICYKFQHGLCWDFPSSILLHPGTRHRVTTSNLTMRLIHYQIIPGLKLHPNVGTHTNELSEDAKRVQTPLAFSCWGAPTIKRMLSILRTTSISDSIVIFATFKPAIVPNGVKKAKKNTTIVE